MACAELYPGAAESNDLRRAVQVVAHGEFGAAARFEPRQRGERHHVALVVPNVELPDVFGAIAVGTLCLDIHLPLTAKAVEVVDERASHERLDGPDRRP